jgi:hypothetical protein
MGVANKARRMGFPKVLPVDGPTAAHRHLPSPVSMSSPYHRSERCQSTIFTRLPESYPVAGSYRLGAPKRLGAIRGRFALQVMIA